MVYNMLISAGVRISFLIVCNLFVSDRAFVSPPSRGWRGKLPSDDCFQRHESHHHPCRAYFPPQKLLLVATTTFIIKSATLSQHSSSNRFATFYPTVASHMRFNENQKKRITILLKCKNHGELPLASTHLWNWSHSPYFRWPVLFCDLWIQ